MQTQGSPQLLNYSANAQIIIPNIPDQTYIFFEFQIQTSKNYFLRIGTRYVLCLKQNFYTPLLSGGGRFLQYLQITMETEFGNFSSQENLDIGEHLPTTHP